MYFSISPTAPSTSYSSAPMDIPSSGSRSSQASCAFPSWPRRSSLSSNSSADEEYHNHSFIISDEELYPCVFDDTEDCTPPATPSSNPSRSPASPMCEQRIVVDHGSLMRDLIAQEKARLEKRDRKRRRSNASNKSRSGSDSSRRMSSIQEAAVE